MSEKRLAGRTVVVTGGSTGIGLACSEECIREGASVLICARNEENLRQAITQLMEIPGARVSSIQADVSNQEDVARVFLRAAAMGNFYGVIHSAGIYGPIGPVTKVDSEQWFDAIRINLFGTFLVAQEAASIMQELNVEGSIVLMSGGGAATPFPNYTAYACSKVGVVRLAETMAQELKSHNIRVNAVAPGFVATRLHNQTLEAGRELAGDFVETTKQKLAEGAVPPTVAARTCAFLLSEDSKGITGKFVAAPYDGWDKWPEKLERIADSDLFTLRRIVPKDRGEDWQ